ncbi:ribonuclease H-like domain-containing protein [Tanacetum coccineum]
MEFETAQNNTTAKLPILKLGEYEMWEMRIKQYFQVQDYALWEVIENGNSWVFVPQTSQENGTSITKMPVPVTAEKKINKKNDVKVRSLLLMSLPNEHQLNFSQYNDAKTMYDAIKTRFGESLDSIFNMLQKLVSRLAILGVVISPEDLNSKFLRSLPPEWNTHVVVCMNKANIETMSIDDLYNNFKIVKQEVKKSVGASNVITVSPNVNTANSSVSTANINDNVVYACMVENPNGSNLLHQDLKQIHEHDLEVMDLKWQLSLLKEATPMSHELPLRSVHSLRHDEGSLSLTELMVLCTSLSKKVEGLESKLKTTKQTYSTPLTKLRKRVKKLEQTIKTSKARRRTKIVVLEEDDALEDSSKQGRKISIIDKDPTISLVYPEHEMEHGVSTAEETSCGSGEKGKAEVSTAKVQISTASATPELSTAAENLVYVRRSADKRKDKGKEIMTELEPEKKTKLQQRKERASLEATIRQLQVEINKAEQEKQEVISEADLTHDIDWSDPEVIRLGSTSGEDENNDAIITPPVQPTQQTPHTISTIKLHILKKGEYDMWAMKMEHYLVHTDYPIWEIIQKGNGPVNVSTDTNGQIKVLPPKIAEEILARERERKAKTTLLMAILEDRLAKFHKMTDAKEMWEAIKSRFGGNDESKKMHKYILKQQFEIFYVSNSEGLHKGYDRSLPSSWSQVSLIMRTKQGVDSLSFDDLYNNLRVFEHDVKSSTVSSSSSQNVVFVSSERTSSTNEVSTAYGVSTSFGHNSQNGQQLYHEDLKQVDEFNLEEMDLKWQVAMISMRLKKFYKKTWRKMHFDVKEPISFDKIKVECFNCSKIGHFAGKCRSKGNQESRRRDVGNTGYKAKDNGRRSGK